MMKVVMAQCNFTVGDLAGNQALMEAAMARWGHETDLIVFSELAVCGYYPMDLLDRAHFIQAQNTVLRALKAQTVTLKAAIVVGAVSENPWAGKAYYNALFVYHKGLEVFHYAKKLLPTYNIFDEARHFEAGQSPGVWLHKGVRLGFLICEDGWNNHDDPNYQMDPVDQLAREKLDLVVSINASPSNKDKVCERVAHFSRISQRCAAPLVYVNQVGGNDEIIFDGHSFLLNAAGQPVECLPGFIEAQRMVDINTIATLPTQRLPEYSAAGLMFQQLTLGLRDYAHKCHFQRVVVGASGGIDSAVTLALAVAALGREAVVGITMPARFSSPGSVDDSMALCKALGIPCHVASIEVEFTHSIKRFAETFGEQPSTLTQENMQARIRGKLLMEYANHFGHLVLSTGNKTEMSIGYATLYGDMNGGLNLLGDVYKLEVYALANYLNQYMQMTVIADTILHKPPSAELSAGQTDEASLLPYPQLDAIVRLVVEQDLMSAEEIAVDLQTLASVPSAEIERIAQKVDQAEFKRRQAPPILRVHRRAFGMGRRLPIAQQFRPHWSFGKSTVR